SQVPDGRRTSRPSSPPTACSCCATGLSARRTGPYSTRSVPGAPCWRPLSGRFPSSPVMPRCTAARRRSRYELHSCGSATRTSSHCALSTLRRARECSAAASSRRHMSASSGKCSVAEPLLTVVICTHNRPADLERCLEGLAALEDDVAVIVVDSASDPALDAVVDGFSSSLRHLTYHYEPEAGLSLARNRGLELARSELVAFLDDDAVPEPSWARNLVGPFEAPGVVCVGGTCRAAFDSERPP